MIYAYATILALVGALAAWAIYDPPFRPFFFIGAVVAALMILSGSKRR